ncbi:ComF family protein [Tautonia rosea]|uniref:ComF family protein n=1 Tax=Tautonia rosea TaxID=2728037 RepID=UPI001473EE17|nr:ComF family protein [Tautonia rosea]
MDDRTRLPINLPGSRIVPRRLTEAVGDLAFPGDCLICDSWIEDARAGLCLDCRDELFDAAGPACQRCALPVGPFADRASGCGDCSGRRYGFDAAVAIGPYEGPIRHLCLRLKSVRGAWLAPRLIDVLAEARAEELANAEARAVVPVPLHPWRRLRRRYNQSEALAQALAHRLGLPMVRALRRVRPTSALWRVGRVERHRQMQGVFQTNQKSLEAILGVPVLLVDDILTTGATCSAASRALKRAGVGPVMAVVIGRVEGKG